MCAAFINGDNDGYNFYPMNLKTNEIKSLLGYSFSLSFNKNKNMDKSWNMWPSHKET